MNNFNVKKEFITSKISKKVSGLRFQPLRLLQDGSVFGYEILSDFYCNKDPEKIIQEMTEREHLSLFIFQANIAIKMKGIYLINLPTCLFVSQEAMTVILNTRNSNRLIIELQDPENLSMMPFKKRMLLSKNIACLQKAGWQIWLDDWKKETDIFTLLPHTCFNGVKIDKSLAEKRNLPELVETARAIAKVIVVEGIETNSVLIHAKKSGADLGQGFLWPQTRILLES